MRYIIPILLILILIPTVAVAPRGVTESVEVDCEFDEDKFLQLVNNARVKDISIDLDLDQISQNRANSLDYFLDNHAGFRKLVADEVFPFDFIHLGENLASSRCPDEKNIFNQFMNSPGHKATMLDSRYDRIGIGFYKGVVVTIYGDLR